MIYRAANGNLLHLMEHGIGKIDDGKTIIYFGFKETSNFIDTTEEVELEKQDNYYTRGSDKFFPTEIEGISEEIDSLPISNELKAFGRTNMINKQLAAGQSKLNNAVENMERMITEARANNIEVPMKAIKMLKTIKEGLMDKA